MNLSELYSAMTRNIVAQREAETVLWGKPGHNFVLRINSG